MAEIEHVIVLMLENRSFDHTFGWLKADRQEIDGLSGDEKNNIKTAVGSLVYRIGKNATPGAQLPFDPPHEFADVNEQLFGTARPAANLRPTMSGFALRAKRASLEHAGIVMDAVAPGSLPAIHFLADEYAICQRWFSSVPGPTWPNRFFAHCGTAGGYLDGKVRIYSMPSVFHRLVEKQRSWRVYYHDVPHTLTLADALKRLPLGRFAKFSDFATDAAQGTLPNYAFIEPNYFDTSFAGGAPNDQHPPTGSLAGDQLVRVVYESLRASPQWLKSVLLVVWDEHGGFYDHVPPPAAVPPESSPGQSGFAFDRLGVRVPAIVVSPWVPRRVVIDEQFEHASIPATLRKLFGIRALTARDAAARPFDGVLSLPTPRDTPRQVPPRVAAAAPIVAPAEPAPMTDLQLSLLELAEQLTLPAGSLSAPRQLPRAVRVERSCERVDAMLLADEQKVVAPAHGGHIHNVRPDRVDLRDRHYQPPVQAAPPPRLMPDPRWVPLDQEQTQACTGYALASLIEYLLAKAGRDQTPVSPRMLYSMARRYDEFEGEDDSGSSLRGALKGWFRHGACTLALWPNDVGIDQLPPGSSDPKQDWWNDALQRPLGAYYRVDTHELADLHSAINEVKAVYASARIHEGWTTPRVVGEDGDAIADIPYSESARPTGGHAFVIVGYDDVGFLALSSWGAGWGRNGVARISYEDWLDNAMDAWVVQLGVATAERRRIARQPSLMLTAQRDAEVARDPVTRDHQLSPFILDAGNQGRLHERGRFRTHVEDLRFLLQHHLPLFRQQRGLAADQPADVAIYAHGGLVDEDAAANTAGHWIPRLYQAGFFPVFVMWESGFGDIIRNLLQDAFQRSGRKAERLGAARDVFDNVLERAVRPIGEGVWLKMKRNAAALTRDAYGGLRVLFELGFSDRTLLPTNVRLHLVGHSAGAIVHAELLNWLIGRGFSIASLTQMAPAVRVDLFRDLVMPQLATKVQRYTQFHLTDAIERSDPTVPIYTKSLLYLVSRSFEGRKEVPILGMERHIPSELKATMNAHLCAAPGQQSEARDHGAFDNDARTARSVLDALLASR